MKKFLFVSFIITFFPTYIFAQASKLLPVIKNSGKSAAKVAKPVPSARVPVAVPVAPVVSAPVTPSLSVIPSSVISPSERISEAAILPPSLPEVSLPTIGQEITLNPEILLEKAAALQRLQDLQMYNAAEIKALQLKYPVLESTFQAMPVFSPNTNHFSGTIFETTYNGQKEVYGVVAAHSTNLNSWDVGTGLEKEFTVVIFPDGKPLPIKAEIVQVSSRRFLDLALVKFPAEYVSLLKPLTLAKGEVQVAETLQSHGYASLSPANIEGRTVSEIFPTSYRTTIPFSRDARPGLCGSAVVNANHELVGIHVGSTQSGADAAADKAFVVPSKMLNSLVEAYHNGGVGTFEFVLGDRKIADLNVDEYIHSMELVTDLATNRSVWRHNIEHKFSYSQVYNALANHPEAGFLRFTTRRTSWDETGKILLEDARGETKTSYLYDLQKNELISVKRPKPKMHVK